MTTIHCPRCHRDAPELTAFCAGCGAPLLLRDEEPAGPIDAPLLIDRRDREPGSGRPLATVDLPGPAATLPPRGSVARAGELADVERSSWDLGAIAVAARERVGPEVSGARNVAVGVGRRPTPTPTPTATATPTAPPTAPLAATVTLPPAATSPSLATRTTTALTRHPLDIPDPEVDALEVHVARAETWRRVVAGMIDAVPFVAAGGGLALLLLREVAAARGGPPRGPEELLDLVSAERVIALSVAGAVALALATYATLAHALGGATLGKRLLGIRVVGPDGRSPSPARSAIRALLAVVSAALLGLGFLLALFTRTGRALHDVLARTWVVKAP